MAESTCANKVVGIFIKFYAPLYILDTKPTTSPVIPPPTLIIKSDRFRFAFRSLRKKSFTTFNDLFFSFALNLKKKDYNF